MQPIVIHLDMNSYFATAEQQDHPEFRGKPLGVCEHLGGIIIAASIEAKRWGIKTGTPVWEARKLYPKIILTHTHPDRYRLYIKRVIKVVSDYTGAVEQYSIDELFADLTKACNIKIPNKKFQITNKSQSLKPKYPSRVEYVQADPFEEAVNIAQTIKRRMKKEVGDWLTCSIGIADNKLLAKIASDMQKPNGLVVVTPDVGQGRALLNRQAEGLRYSADYLVFSKPDLYQRLKLTDIPGIARRQEKNLNALGIKTLLDLKNYPLSWLIKRFGVNGYHLHQMGNLRASWKPEVEKDELIKSIGHMYTLPKEFREKKFFVPVLYKLCEMVAKRLRKQELMGNVIHFYLRDKDYEGYGESKKLGFCVYDGREIFLQCMRVFEGFKMSSGEFKLIGVTVAGLRPYIAQLSLFGHEERLKRTVGALDKINAKYGDFTLCRVPILAAGRAFRDSIGFGRIKEK